jgi:hypothetical protein
MGVAVPVLPLDACMEWTKKLYLFSILETDPQFRVVLFLRWTELVPPKPIR